MRRPHTASSGKRNRTRILKKGPGRRISRHARLESVALPIEVEANGVETSAASETAASAVVRNGAGDLAPGGAEPAPIGDRDSSTPARARTACAGDPGSRACYGFGAVRVGPLLGRLRLHLQTERFLAVHRSDALWEEGCMQAALALAGIVEGMSGAEFDAPLSSREAQSSGAPSRAPECLQLRVTEPTLANPGWGSRKIGTAALAACGAALARQDAQSRRASATAQSAMVAGAGVAARGAR